MKLPYSSNPFLYAFLRRILYITLRTRTFLSFLLGVFQVAPLFWGNSFPLVTWRSERQSESHLLVPSLFFRTLSHLSSSLIADCLHLTSHSFETTSSLTVALHKPTASPVSRKGSNNQLTCAIHLPIDWPSVVTQIDSFVNPYLIEDCNSLRSITNMVQALIRLFHVLPSLALIGLSLSGLEGVPVSHDTICSHVTSY